MKVYRLAAGGIASVRAKGQIAVAAVCQERPVILRHIVHAAAELHQACRKAHERPAVLFREIHAAVRLARARLEPDQAHGVGIDTAQLIIDELNARLRFGVAAAGQIQHLIGVGCIQDRVISPVILRHIRIGRPAAGSVVLLGAQQRTADVRKHLCGTGAGQRRLGIEASVRIPRHISLLRHTGDRFRRPVAAGDIGKSR